MSKERKEVMPKGLNLYDTINRVEDGWCRRVHNLSFRGGQLTSVTEHKSIDNIADSSFTILYIYPLLPKGDYIAYKEGVIYHITNSVGTVTTKGTITTLPLDVLPHSIEVTHFGESLFIKYSLNNEPFQEIYTYSDGVFSRDNFELLRELENIEIKYTFSTPSNITTEEYAPKFSTVHITTNPNGVETIESIDKHYEGIIADMANANYIHGSAYLIFAIKLRSGEIVRSSKIYMLNSENGADNQYGTLFKRYLTADKSTIDYCKYIHGYTFEVNFEDNTDIINNPLVQSVIIYSTRMNPLYDYENVHTRFPSDSSRVIEYDNGYIGTSANCIAHKNTIDALSYPFYQLAELELHSNSSIVISAKDYANIETQAVYSAMAAPHSYQSAGGIGLNGRWHQFNITGRAYTPSIPLVEDDTIKLGYVTYGRNIPNIGETDKVGVCVTLNFNGEEIKVNNISSESLFYPVIIENDVVTFRDEPSVILPNLISYPDIRATKVEVFITRYNNDKAEIEAVLLRTYELTPIASINYAVYRNTTLDSINSYEVIPVKNIESNDYTIIESGRLFTIPNLLMVSEWGAPQIFQPKHFYYVGNVGDSAIREVNIPLDQLTESGFGMFPLYLFTDSGIYGMQQGDGTILYQYIVRINSDIISPSSNSVSALSALYYISDYSIRKLRGSSSVNISIALAEQYKEFISGAELYFQPSEEELLIINSNFDYALVYSIGSSMWSSRDFGGLMLDYKHYIDGTAIYDLYTQEEGNSPDCELITRELNFGTTRPKQLRELITLINSTQPYTVTLSGSIDGKNWATISSESDGGSIKRDDASWRWFELSIKGKNISIDGFIANFRQKYRR